jgi:hypothetical protein
MPAVAAREVDRPATGGTVARRLVCAPTVSGALPEPDGDCAVVAFAPAGPVPDSVEVRHLVWYLVALERPATRCVAQDGVCYAVVPGAGVAAVAAGVVERFRAATGVPLLAAVGPLRSGRGAAETSRDEADLVLGVLRRRPDLGPVAGAADVRAHTAVASIGSLVAGWPHLRLPELATLRAHDEAHGTGYVATLAAYLARFGDANAAAALVGVHPNTFRYRLRRLVELTGLDLDDPGRRLACELELAAGT